MTLSIALLGAGIFAREEYIPAINANDKFCLKAIYSRSQKSAEALARHATASPDLYFDNPAGSGKALDDLFNRSDIGAVIVCLPITVQPAVIRKAFAAGKHVISEKPIAKDVQTATELVALHKGLSTPPIWAVAENFRLLKPISLGASKLKELGGSLVTFSLSFFTNVEDDNKYFQTEWRHFPEYQGGFLLDGGIHCVAVLRYLLTAIGQNVTDIAAYTALLQKKLLPVDTIHAIWNTESGRSGSFNVSFGTEFKSGSEFEVVTTLGSVKVTVTSVTVTRKDAESKKTEEKEEFSFNSGVAAELEAFAESVNAGKLDPRLSPQEALSDLRVLQSMLESGEAKGIRKQIAATL